MKSPFKKRTRPDKILGDHTVSEYQCPACKRWFHSYSGGGYNQVGIKVHLARLAKVEIFEKQLGDRKDAPHFDFYKKSTVKVQVREYPRYLEETGKCRVWKI